MKNALPFNKLVLVDGSGHPISGSDTVDDATVDYLTNADLEAAVPAEAARSTHTTLIVVVAVSIACLTAAIASGSYAIWLSRRQAAQQALTDVNDLLKTCQTRMYQLESDFQNRPSRSST